MNLLKISKKSHTRLDSLILNAGIMVTPFGLTVDGIEQQIGVNHFGHFYLTRLLLEVLEATAKPSNPTTISVVSSGAHYHPYPQGIKSSLEELNDEATFTRLEAYGQSKFANVLFAQELAERVKSKHILVNVIHPGAVFTDLIRHAFEFLQNKGVPNFVIGWIRTLLETIAWNPEIASYTQLYVAISPEIKDKKVTGKYFHPIARENVPHPLSKNVTLQKAFWKLSEEILNSKLQTCAISD